VGNEAAFPVDDLAPLYFEVIDAYVILTRTPRSAPTWIIKKGDALHWVRRWVDVSEISVGALSKMAKRFDGKTSGGYVLYKLANQAYADGKTGVARDNFDKYVHAYPKHEYVADARVRLTELGRKVDGGYVPIGVVLPFSGRYGRYGKAVLRGIECGAGILRPCDSDMEVRLIIRDTGGDPQKAAEAFQDVIGAEYVLSVIGPLARVEVDPIARQAELHQVPIITLSQKKNVTESGRYVFRNFLTIEDQVQTLVRQVCSSEDRNIAVLYPNSNVGLTYKDLFVEGVKECGAEIKAIQAYQPKGGNFQDAIRGLKFSVSSHGLDEGLGFDALFIPDSYRNLSQIFPLLSFLNVKDVRLYGTAGWNNTKLTAEFPEVMEGAVFVGGFFAASNAGPTRRFARSYAQAYGNDPSFLEAYGYDSLQLIKHAVKNRRSAKRSEIQEVLSEIKSFPGSTGAITIDRFGDAKRRLFLLTVRDGKIEEF
jgi:ABC-type branched-subunit amino acid transport system substrate-binding protein